MVNSGTQFGKVIIKVACRTRAGQTLPLGVLRPKLKQLETVECKDCGDLS